MQSRKIETDLCLVRPQCEGSALGEEFEDEELDFGSVGLSTVARSGGKKKEKLASQEKLKK